MNTVTPIAPADYVFPRGQYIAFVGERTPGTRYRRFTHRERITRSTGGVVTVRKAHTWRPLEWLHARLEDWVVWPIRDLWGRE